MRQEIAPLSSCNSSLQSLLQWTVAVSQVGVHRIECQIEQSRAACVQFSVLPDISRFRIEGFADQLANPPKWLLVGLAPEDL